jgi:CubicO group peptidase (beta-lactamase class C family)
MIFSLRFSLYHPRLVGLAVLACALPAAAGGLAADKVRDIEKAISEEMGKQQVPGLSAAVAQDLRLAWSGGFGMSDLENSVPARASTVYRLGSISKPITAVAVMQLAERDQLDLDAPIQKYVPAFPEKPWPITARLLLAHLSGIRHYRDQAEVQSTRHYTDLLEPLKIFAADALLFEPGAKHLYSTYGYVLLGAAVEGASGMKFLDYLRQNIFKPSGMERIRADSVYDLIPQRARGYRKMPWGEIQNCALADTSNKIPGGGLVSTADDLVKFAIALNKGTLLKKATVEQMFTLQNTRDGKLAPYGLGWRMQELAGKKWVGHEGSQPGVSTFLLMVPADGFVVAILANLEGLDLGPLAVRMAQVVLR